MVQKFKKLSETAATPPMIAKLCMNDCKNHFWGFEFMQRCGVTGWTIFSEISLFLQSFLHNLAIIGAVAGVSDNFLNFWTTLLAHQLYTDVQYFFLLILVIFLHQVELKIKFLAFFGENLSSGDQIKEISVQNPILCFGDFIYIDPFRLTPTPPTHPLR